MIYVAFMYDMPIIFGCQESSVIHSNANLGVHGQGLLNLSGPGDLIEAQRLILSLFYSINVRQNLPMHFTVHIFFNLNILFKTKSASLKRNLAIFESFEIICLSFLLEEKIRIILAAKQRPKIHFV